jgi:hypothetical protein
MPLPLQMEDLTTETSRLDTGATPRHLTDWEDSTADVVFQSASKPQKFLSSNPRVATADLIPAQIFRSLGANAWPVQVSGHNPGTALITPVDGNGKTLFNLPLEVDVLRRQEYHVNFHLVTDWLGGTTARSEASAVQTDLSVVNDVFAPANISFVLHATRSIKLPTHFDSKVSNVQDLNQRMGQLIQSARHFDGSIQHIQVFCVGMLHWLDGVRQGVDTQGYTQGRTIVIEDDAGPAVLPHEIGHALGLKHNQRGTTLMNEFPTGTLLTREDIRKIGMLR